MGLPSPTAHMGELQSPADLLESLHWPSEMPPVNLPQWLDKIRQVCEEYTVRSTQNGALWSTGGLQSPECRNLNPPCELALGEPPPAL